jgi:hypothetical protein
MLLTHHFLEILWPPFAGHDQVRHGGKDRFGEAFSGQLLRPEFYEDCPGDPDKTSSQHHSNRTPAGSGFAVLML